MAMPERMAVVESKLERLETVSDRHEALLVQAQLSDAEQKVNWRLAVALGSLVGSIAVGLVLMIATRAVA